MPEELDGVERRIKQLEIEREAVRREKEPGTQERLDAIDRELAEQNQTRTGLKAHWEVEKKLIQSIRGMKEEVERARTEAEKKEREGDLGRVAEIRYGVVAGLEKKIRAASDELGRVQKDRKMLKEEVDAEDIAEIVSRWTGIPVTRMLEGERMKLLHLEDRLHERVVAQDEAVRAVSDAIRRARAGLQDEKRPLGSFIFLGSTGVGKTELARALAEFLFNDESAMVRIDMSEYMEKFSVSRLIGAPPGYVGYEEGGQLTEAVRRKPYSVVLLDEIEKAHAEVFDVLLQVLDEGRLTDSKGRTVDFKNTIIIMTSNLGSQLISDRVAAGFAAGEERWEKSFLDLRQELLALLKKTIRPEFLNRIDEVIVFRPLGRDDIQKVVALQLRRVEAMLEKKGIRLRVTDDARDWLATLGFDPQYGARPLKRVIQRHLVNPLAEKLLAGEFADGDMLEAVLGKEGTITFVRKKGT
jgi:ATP-dependent Clp protease ATP-binding subunit ClpB